MDGAGRGEGPAEPKLGRGALTLGRGALTLGRGALTLGRGALTLGCGALTLGRGALTLGRGAFALGRGALTLGRGELALGRGALEPLPRCAASGAAAAAASRMKKANRYRAMEHLVVGAQLATRIPVSATKMAVRAPGDRERSAGQRLAFCRGMSRQDDTRAPCAPPRGMIGR